MKKFRYLLPAVLFCAALLWSCSAGEGGGEDGPVLWFAGDVADWSGGTAAMVFQPYNGPMTVDGMMDALLTGPSVEGALSPFPRGTRLVSWTLDRDTLRLDLSGEYGALSGVDLTLADHCLAMTMEQLSGVERVAVTVEGQPIGARYRQELSGDGVILSGAEEQPVEVSALLYFPRYGGRGLGFEGRVFQLTEDDVLVETVTRALLAGPGSAALTSLIPPGTQLLSVSLEDGVCSVDLSEAFLEQMPADEDSQTLIVYSLVDTLGNLDNVTAVVLKVNGEPLERYGAVRCAGGLEPDFGLVGGH